MNKTKLFRFPITSAKCGDILLQDLGTGAADWWSPDPKAITVPNSEYKLHHKDTVEVPNSYGLSSFYPVKDFLEIVNQIKKMAGIK